MLVPPPHVTATPDRVRLLGWWLPAGSGLGVSSLVSRVEAAVSGALERTRLELSGADPVVRPSEHADFQSNAALALVKRTRSTPAELARDVAEALRADASSPIAEVTASGPGFLNLVVPDPAVWEQVTARLAGPRLGIGTPERGRRTVVDYSAPNIAKEMHVGHLRTTIIGDCLVRVLTFLVADVVRQNHLGDWGTQFGMLIQYLDEHPDAGWRHDQLAGDTSAVSALDGLHRAARAAFDSDSGFADRARSRVVALQAGDEATVARWREIVAESELAFREIYDRLGVLLEPADSAGESFYNAWLPDVVDELTQSGIAVERLSDAELDQIAEHADIGAVKYADLSTSRTKDYSFDVERMVSFSGNTGVYLQYAHTRICSILRKAGYGLTTVDPTQPLHPAERALALTLDGFGDVVAEVGRLLEPHRLCVHLHELAKAFTDFYEACPVLTAEESTRANRIALCQLTARTLREGLGLLGIAALERM